MIKSDKFGNIYVLDTDINAWIKRGIITSPPVVNKDQDGFINPRIYRKLKLLENNNLDIKPFKIWLGDSGIETNYYYLRSPSGTISIDHYDDILQFEINQHMLNHKIVKLFQQPGPKGYAGRKGKTGRNGIQVAAEEFFYGEVIEAGLYIDQTINTPVNTEISLRIYDDNSEIQIAEIYISLDNVISIVSGNDYINNIDLEFNNNLLSGVINLKYSWDVKFKARQRGKKGKTGVDGVDYLEVISSTLDGELMSKNAVINIRKADSGNNIYYSEDEIFKEFIAQKLGLYLTTVHKNDVYPSIQLDNIVAKKMGVYDLQLESLNDPIYYLPEWTPITNCRNFSGLEWHSDYEGVILEDDFKMNSYCDQEFTYNNGGECACIGDTVITPDIIDKTTSGISEHLPPGGLILDSLYKDDINVYEKEFSGTVDIFHQKVLFSGDNKIEISIESNTSSINSEIIISPSDTVNIDIANVTEYSKLPIDVTISASSNKYYYNQKDEEIKRLDYVDIIIKINTNKIKTEDTYKLTIETYNG